MIEIQIIIKDDIQAVVGSFEGVTAVCLADGLDVTTTSVKRLLSDLQARDTQVAVYTPDDSIDVLNDRPFEQRLLLDTVCDMLNYLEEKENRIYVSDVPHI